MFSPLEPLLLELLESPFLGKFFVLGVATLFFCFFFFLIYFFRFGPLLVFFSYLGTNASLFSSAILPLKPVLGSFSGTFFILGINFFFSMSYISLLLDVISLLELLLLKLLESPFSSKFFVLGLLFFLYLVLTLFLSGAILPLE